MAKVKIEKNLGNKINLIIFCGKTRGILDFYELWLIAMLFRFPIKKTKEKYRIIVVMTEKNIMKMLNFLKNFKFFKTYNKLSTFFS